LVENSRQNSSTSVSNDRMDGLEWKLARHSQKYRAVGNAKGDQGEENKVREMEELWSAVKCRISIHVPMNPQCDKIDIISRAYRHINSDLFA
jgi:hypothetical protein